MRKIILLAVFIIYFAAIAGAQMYYNIVLYSPVADAVFYLGEKIDFRMEVMEGTEKISGANAVANLPGATLALSESGGAYTGNYTLKWNDNPGIWNIKIKAEKGTFRGERNVSVRVNPVKLSIQILFPQEYVISNEQIEIKVNVSYPDGSPFNGKVTASTPYNDDTLENAGGYYRYTFPSKDGFWTLKINASDGKNSGYSERMFLISRKSVITSILEYWYIIAMPFVLVSVILFFVKMPDILLVRLRKRESKLKGLLIETQEKYFSEKTINPKNFKDIETKYKSQYESVKADIAELENKDRRLRGYLYRKIHERAKNKESAPVAEENVRNKGKADEENNKNKKEKKPASDSNEKKGWEDEALSGKEK